MASASKTLKLGYTRDVELVLIPHLGHYRLSDLDGPLLRAVFADIARTTNAKGTPQSPSALSARTPRSGPTAGSNSGNAPVNTPRSPSGPPTNSAASSRA